MFVSRNKIAMLVAEFLGTGVLTLVVLSVSKSTIGIPYFIAIAAGLVVAAMTMAVGAISGAHLNPAITLGLWSTRRIKTLPAIVYICVQLLGAAAAYMLFKHYVMPDQPWPNNGKFEGRVLVFEAIGAGIFALGWAAAAFQKMELGKAAAVVGMSLVLGILVASAAGGGILNPAVALGARSWVWGSFVLGPVLGAVIGFNLYALLFAPAAQLTETVDKPKKK